MTQKCLNIRTISANSVVGGCENTDMYGGITVWQPIAVSAIERMTFTNDWKDS
jgi:hypothetical protein